MKVVLPRTHMFEMTGHRPQTVQRIRFGADAEGRLQAIGHDVWSENNPNETFNEPAAQQTRNLYAGEHRRTTHRLVILDTPIGCSMRAPGEAVGMLALGALRDSWAGTSTPTSRRSRAIMATTTAVAGLATAASGAMPGVASLMVAFTAYTAMRDLLVQSRLRMSNANTSDYVPDATHFALISAGYGLDQGLVSLGMSTLASPSGAGAYLRGVGVQLWNDIRRGALNWAGEVGEDLMFQGIPAVRSTLDPAQPGHALQLSIRDVGYQRNNVVNAALG